MIRVTRRQSLALAAAGAVALGTVLTGCQGAPEIVPSQDHVTDVAAIIYIGDNFYEPESVEIAAGEAVRWEWVGKEKHDVVSDDRSFVSELQTEGSYTHVFEEAGDFSYLCSTHPEMRGLVIVE